MYLGNQRLGPELIEPGANDNQQSRRNNHVMLSTSQALHDARPLRYRHPNLNAGDRTMTWNIPSG
jgi:hypothetical protein